MFRFKWNAIRELGWLASSKLILLMILHKIKLLNLGKSALYKKYNNLIFLAQNNIKYHVGKDGLVECHATVPQLPFPFVIRANDSDPIVVYQIFVQAEYSPLVDLYKTHFGDNPTVILDAGANIGLTSLYFGGFFPLSRIISIEPDPDNFKMLERNLNNSRLPYFTPLQNALWSSNEPLSIDRQFRDKQSWSLRVTHSKQANSIVEGITIQKILDDFNLPSIDILKIDIEGAEGEIFKDNKGTTFLSKVKAIGLEIHDELVDRKAIEQILSDAGFVLFHSGESVFGYNKNLKTGS